MSSGMSEGRLARIASMLDRRIDEGMISGAVVLVERHGEVAYREARGFRDLESGDPMQPDTLFRIASMTKPVTVTAALTLVEEGALRLDDPVDSWLPELAGRPVIRRPAAALDDVEPLERPITLRDLCTHRSGLISAGRLRGPLGDALRDIGELWTSELTGDEWIARLGSLPLLFQPGSRFAYGISHDVLGLLISRVTGLPFPDALRERLFEPLTMTKTAFRAVEPSRLAVPYHQGPNGGLVPDPFAHHERWLRNPAFPSGAGGLVSTAADYARFGRMLLNGGVLEGTRVLSRKTIELMTTDQLTAAQRATTRNQGRLFFTYRGYGLGVSIVDDQSCTPGLASLGSFGWGGYFGSWWSADPSEDLLSVLMMQVSNAEENLPVAMDFQTLVLAAIDD